MDYNKLALEMHEQNKGKIAVRSKVTVKTRDDLSTAYTPGVAEPCRKIRDNKEEVYRYTAKGNLVAVVSDGTAVLGLGDIGPEAAMPVMEGKALLFKEFADIDAFPICLDTKDVDEIVETVKRIAPVFGGINLEDISAPRCFEIERRLKEELELLAEYILEGKDISSNEKIEKHAAWVAEFLPKYDNLDKDNIQDVLRKEVGNVFVHVLEDAGVYKCTADGRAAFMRFIDTL